MIENEYTHGKKCRSIESNHKQWVDSWKNTEKLLENHMPAIEGKLSGISSRTMLTIWVLRQKKKLLKWNHTVDGGINLYKNVIKGLWNYMVSSLLVEKHSILCKNYMVRLYLTKTNEKYKKNPNQPIDDRKGFIISISIKFQSIKVTAIKQVIWEVFV